MNFRPGLSRRPSSQRRAALFGGAVVLIVGLVAGLIALGTVVDRAGGADSGLRVGVVAAPAEVAAAESGSPVASGHGPGCRKTPGEPMAPVRATVPHREDIRLPLAVHDVPSAAGVCPEASMFRVVGVVGSPPPALDLTTVLRI